MNQFNAPARDLCRLARVLAIGLAWAIAAPASAGTAGLNPLEPIDTSSPRSTLQGFLDLTSQAYHRSIGHLNDYLASGELNLSAQEVANVKKSQDDIRMAGRALDFSNLPPAMAEESSRRLTVQLREILDRIELPPPEAIPDAKAMDDMPFKRWTIPGTEIRIVQVEKGPHAGEYLFDPLTVERISEFYDRAKSLPYKPDSAEHWYESIAYAPAGIALLFHEYIPPRWFFMLPRWMIDIRFLDQPVWRWIGIVIVVAVAFFTVALCFRLSRRWAGVGTPTAMRWSGLLRPLSLVIVAPLTAQVLARVLRISGGVYQAGTLALWSLFFIALAWSVWAAGGALAESLIGTERIKTSRIDNQLIRLVARLATIVLVIAILVVGGDRLGLPAYSVVAGLGVGGLAVALAAQQTLANLLGSLIIMFERPFSIGHSIKVDGVEGTVEDVGFRSTRIRTPDNSLVTIPSSELVSNIIDNRQLRTYRRVHTTLNLANETPLAGIRVLLAAIETILRSHPHTRKDNISVVLHDIGTGGPDILLNFYLKVPDKTTEQQDRQDILMAILEAVEGQSIRFR